MFNISISNLLDVLHVSKAPPSPAAPTAPNPSGRVALHTNPPTYPFRPMTAGPPPTLRERFSAGAHVTALLRCRDPQHLCRHTALQLALPEPFNLAMSFDHYYHLWLDGYRCSAAFSPSLRSHTLSPNGAPTKPFDVKNGAFGICNLHISANKYTVRNGRISVT